MMQEILADLNTCLEELQARALEIESRMERYTEHATRHMRLAKAPTHTLAQRQRELLRAKMFMQDRQRLRAEHEKTLRMMHLLQTQIDSIMASNVDALVVQTMRSYNSTAAQLAVPALTSQLESLSSQLDDRTHELGRLQEALNSIATPATGLLGDEDGMDDASLMQELDQLLLDDSAPTTQATESVVVVSLPEPVSLPSVPVVSLPSVPRSEPEELVVVVSLPQPTEPTKVGPEQPTRPELRPMPRPSPRAPPPAPMPMLADPPKQRAIPPPVAQEEEEEEPAPPVMII